jgi:FlaA1/EpsC-like NDP-sugar epimerase
MNTLSVEQATRSRFGAYRSKQNSVVQFWQQLSHVRKSPIVLFVEVALAALSYSLAVLALAETRGSDWIVQTFRETLGLLIIFRLAAAVGVGLYRRSLRYASVLDLILILKAVAASSVLLWAVIWWQFRGFAIPAAVFLMDAAFLILFWSGLHFGGRIVRAQGAAARKAGKPVVIVGAGDAGMQVLKELVLDPVSSHRPVAIVDDDPLKWKRSFCGVRVEGSTVDLARIAIQNRASEILICIPSATRSQMHDILNACRESKIPVRTLPSISELMDGTVSRQDLRRPRIEDLLQREEVQFDVRETRNVVGGKTVLVTGAGGSIGSELCRQIAAANPRKLLLLDKSENSLFYVHLEMSERLGANRVKPLFVDLVHADRVRDALRGSLRNENLDIVFHAAAHKHVGLLELHPHEAIRNNVLGTRNIAEAALECGVTRFVNISTDKAVSPQNYMGLSKRITELCMQELAATTGARFSSVRFGNVAGSTGSVLRLFWDQIRKGAPIRVTDPRAARYFMSVPEAVHLILRAAALGTGGETFVFDMGEPLNIYELAKTMMLFSGLRPDEDLPIEFTGLKTGEKVNEELWERWERPVPTECERILVIRQENMRARGILAQVRTMEELLAAENRKGLLDFVNTVVPEFQQGRPNNFEEPAQDAVLAGASRVEVA